MYRINGISRFIRFRKTYFQELLKLSPNQCQSRAQILKAQQLQPISDLSHSSRSYAAKSEKETFYITTPIFYVNAVPHIGHLYTAVLADAISRWHTLKQRNVVFATGTDEHGLKVQQASEKHGSNPQQFCDEVSKKFQALFNEASVDYTDWIRTTENRHHLAVQHFWEELKKRDMIYKGSYEGWYCTADEAFLTEDQLIKTQIEGKTHYISKESGHPVDWTKEDNYMFKLSQCQDKLLAWLDKRVIKPVSYEHIVRQWVNNGLQDLSVSRERSRQQWGIPVPNDGTQTIYVWLDALVNYLTVSGYPRNSYHWPADCHVIGKDILKFHAVYWPAFLMAAELEPPKSILVHSHWTINNQKMSKSKGNVVDPFDRLRSFGVDGLRYYLLKQDVLHSDGNYMDTKVAPCIKADLINTYSNLLYRTTGVAINPDQVIPRFDVDTFRRHASDQARTMLQDLLSLPGKVEEHYNECNFHKGLECIMAQLRHTNLFIQQTRPWELSKSSNMMDRTWLKCILCVSLETLRIAGILLQPVTPASSDRLFNRLSLQSNERSWADVCDMSVDKLRYYNRKDRFLGDLDGQLLEKVSEQPVLSIL